MSQMFKIEIPASLFLIEKRELDIEDDTVGYAIETLFAVDEKILMYWNGFEIPLSMKYDISDIWRDIIIMIRTIKENKKENFRIHWPSCTFFSTWCFTVDNNLLKIEAYWTDVGLSKEDLYKLRAANTPIIIDKLIFLSEWYKIIIFVKNTLFSVYNNSVRNLEYSDIFFEIEV